MDKKSLTALSGLLGITIPLSLIIWFFVYNSNDNLTPLRIFHSIFTTSLLAIYAIINKSVDLSGAIAGFICSVIFMLCNYAFAISLLFLFLIGSKATKFRGDVKDKFEENYEKSSKRNWVQIVCNLGIAAQISVFCLIENGPGCELPLDFQKLFVSSCLIVGVLGSFSCCLGDTLASELGVLAGDPILITTFKRVPRGTNGGVSGLGLFVSALGGLIIGICYICSLYLFVDYQKVVITYPQYPILLICTLSGLYGSILDSYLGAILQFTGKNIKTGKIVSAPGPNIVKINGFNLLDNHTVNLLSTAITPIFSIIISIYFYQYLIVN